MRAGFRALGHAVPALRGSGPRARPAGAGVYSGWIGPDGRVEEVPGTAVHVALLARFGERSKDGFFAKGAGRFVEPPITSALSSWAITLSRSQTRSMP